MANVQTKLAQFRVARGYTVNGLATASGVPEATIRSWERGTIPRVDKLEQVAVCLGVPLAELVPRSLPAGPGLVKARTNLEQVEALVRETRDILAATGEGN
ncbi:MAG TPA: helix-turn-helix transcriptional regulator [Polyangiaceae bacterium]|nr:helix-turn-helix transcriptional regulator [Polyangiaceae bacterium]